MTCENCGRRTEDVTDGLCTLCHTIAAYMDWWRQAIKHTDAIRVKPPDRGLTRQRPHD